MVFTCDSFVKTILVLFWRKRGFDSKKWFTWPFSFCEKLVAWYIGRFYRRTLHLNEREKRSNPCTCQWQIEPVTAVHPSHLSLTNFQLFNSLSNHVCKKLTIWSTLKESCQNSSAHNHLSDLYEKDNMSLQQCCRFGVESDGAYINAIN